MKPSGRNQIKGKLVGVRKGQTTGHGGIDIGNGVVITAAFTNEGLTVWTAASDDAIAVIKTSDVMVAK